MFGIALFGGTMIIVTVIMHAIGTFSWVWLIAVRYATKDDLFRAGTYLRIWIGTLLVLLVLHAAEILLWAYAYLLLVPSGELESLEEAVYFSFVTYTTLGYGDITLAPGWRLLSAIEALNGLLLGGWSTALLFVLVQRTWKRIDRERLQKDQ